MHIENKKKIRLFSREFQNVKFLVPPQNLARLVFLQTIGLLNTYCAIFCAFGVNSQNIKDILEVCVTWMRYMKVNLPFGFGSFDFWRRRREEKWVCHQGSLWAPWSCNRAPRACCKGMKFRETVKNALKRNRRSLLSLHSFSAVFGRFSKGRYILLISRVFSLFCLFLSAEHGVNPPYHNEWMKTV